MTISSDDPEASFRDTSARDHVRQLAETLSSADLGQLQRWGQHLARVLRGGGRLLAAGNGGSAAQAQHLTAELVGRFHRDREAFSAIALHADTSAVTAIANDYGYEEVYARQVRAHGRQGDVLLLFSTSGQSANLLRAASAGRARGLTVWALTGAAPNPLAALCTAAIPMAVASAAAIQECHAIAVHLLCAAFEDAVTPTALSAGSQVTKDLRSSQRPLVIVGDALLDQDLTGRVERVSPEAPALVVDEVQTAYRPGGAGLAGLLAARADRPVVLVTALASDEAGCRLAELLNGAGIRVIDLGLSGPTPVKSRVRSGGRTLLMLSQAPTDPSPVSRSLTDAERDAVLQAGAALVSDYGGGIAGQPDVRDVLTTLATQVPVVWDVRERGAEPVAGVRLLTPDASTAARLTASVTGNDLGSDIDRGQQLLRTWPVASVAVTRGSEGAVLLDGEEAFPLVIPAVATLGGDSCGAGDCFAATAAGLLADGHLVSEAVVGAVAAASHFVACGGASTVTGPARAPSQFLPAAPPADGVVAQTRAGGGTVVATSGCFDLLHAGHVAMLEHARSLGGCLIVCLNDDDSVRRLKGEDRPIVPAADRASVLRGLASVDEVVIFGEDRPDNVLRRIRPDVYVKGGDYRVDDVLEAPLVASWNGRTVIVPYMERWSTSRVISKVIQRARTASDG